MEREHGTNAPNINPTRPRQVLLIIKPVTQTAVIASSALHNEQYSRITNM